MLSGLTSLRERWRDPLLTALTLLLALLMFGLAPLRAADIPGVQELGFAIALVVTGAVLVLSGNLVAIVMLLLAIGLAGAAAIFRLQQSSLLLRHAYRSRGG